jgi:hypothetical protein
MRRTHSTIKTLRSKVKLSLRRCGMTSYLKVVYCSVTQRQAEHIKFEYI